MNKVIDKGFRSCRFVSTIVKHPVDAFAALRQVHAMKHEILITKQLKLVRLATFTNSS